MFMYVSVYMGFLWMLLLVAHGQRDPNAFYLNTHIKQSFCGNAPATMAIQDVFNWAKTSLLSNLFGQYPGKYSLQKGQSNRTGLRFYLCCRRCQLLATSSNRQAQ